MYKSWTKAALSEFRNSLATEANTSNNDNPTGGTKRKGPLMRYACQLDRITAEVLQQQFMLLEADTETQEFIQECYQVGIVAYAMTMFLRNFWSVTDTNAYVGAGQMFVFSTQHAARLLQIEKKYVEEQPGKDQIKEKEEKDQEKLEEKDQLPQIENLHLEEQSNGKGGKLDKEKAEDGVQDEGKVHIEGQDTKYIFKKRELLLDIGAGDGNVTRRLKPLFEKVITTEVSAPMIPRLQARGFAALNVSDLSSEEIREYGQFDVISLLNVLDRCDKPLTLLHQIKSLLKPDTGLLFLAVVLPFRPFVESGTAQLPPSEKLGLSFNARFEFAVNEIVEKVFILAGFKVVRWSRVPYISHSFNSSDYPYCTLDDALFVLAPASDD